MDWFERLTGFPEKNYWQTRERLEIDNGRLRSKVNERSFGIGNLEVVSLKTLRDRVNAGPALPGRLKLSIVQGDVRSMHQEKGNAHALFQVASQFNLLEMTGPNVTPEDGVTIYEDDRTQGPACAIAAGAATIYRNYFATVGTNSGQTRDCQIDGLAEIGKALGIALERSVESLWSMRNGYAMCTPGGLDAISTHLRSLNPTQTDALRALLCVGLHSDVEVTDSPQEHLQLVSQIFCSALPVAYSRLSKKDWEVFAILVLEAAYEATIWAAVLNANRSGSNIVLLTRLGGGAFGNEDRWIDAAMRRAFTLARGVGLDVRIVSFRRPSQELIDLVSEFK
jgi:hypothetical protein